MSDDFQLPGEFKKLVAEAQRASADLSSIALPLDEAVKILLSALRGIGKSIKKAGDIEKR